MTTEQKHDPVFRTVNLAAETKKIWGKEWGQPEVEYEFSNDRKFTRQTGDCAVYASSPDFYTK